MCGTIGTETVEIQEQAEQTEQAPATAPEPVHKKRGRKPNPNKKKDYFSETEEELFRQYCMSNDKAFRNKVFNETLYPAFTKMVESIIRRYTLFTPGEEFQDTFNDVMSHLISKVEKFDVTKNKKAYSYCGTICKNYALHKREKTQEAMQRNISYESMFNEANPDSRTVEGFKIYENDLARVMMRNASKEIRDMIENPEEYNLSEPDIKVGYALINILTDWDSIFSEFESKKYNKSQVDAFIKETTMLTTRQIRESKKKFSSAYFKMKQDFLNRD